MPKEPIEFRYRNEQAVGLFAWSGAALLFTMIMSEARGSAHTALALLALLTAWAHVAWSWYVGEPVGYDADADGLTEYFCRHPPVFTPRSQIRRVEVGPRGARIHRPHGVLDIPATRVAGWPELAARLGGEAARPATTEGVPASVVERWLGVRPGQAVTCRLRPALWWQLLRIVGDGLAACFVCAAAGPGLLNLPTDLYT